MRIVFDEGHHVFEAADSTFAAALTGQEAIELKRWIVGPEKGSKGRRRGLAARLADVASYDEAGGKAIANGEFEIYYQPILYLQTGRVSGFEALVRWQDPSGEVISRRM